VLLKDGAVATRAPAMAARRAAGADKVVMGDGAMEEGVMVVVGEDYPLLLLLPPPPQRALPPPSRSPRALAPLP